MGVFDHPIVRGGLFIGGLVAWLACVLAMGALAVVWHEVAIEPAHENTMAGIAWIFFGPGIPLGMGIAAALLYTGWDTFTTLSRRWALVTAWSVPGLGLGFFLGLVLTGSLASPIVMDVALALHAGAMISLHLHTLIAGAAPWTTASRNGEGAVAQKNGMTSATRRMLILFGSVVWLLLFIGMTLHSIGSIAQAVLPIESTASIKNLGWAWGWCGPLLALFSYALVELSADALARGAGRWQRWAKRSSIALFLVTALVLILLGEVELPLALLESVVFVTHSGTMGTAFVLTLRHVGWPWHTASMQD